jgi:hypothetical protein
VKVIEKPLALFSPSFDKKPCTTISAPAFSESLVKPRRTIVFGVPASIIHGTVLPSSPTTSMWIHECGLIHSIFVTLPCSVTGLFSSNSAENE